LKIESSGGRPVENNRPITAGQPVGQTLNQIGTTSCDIGGDIAPIFDGRRVNEVIAKMGDVLQKQLFMG
jgi:hypothetical protein